MPVVPFSKAAAPRPQRELPPEPFALMAAAQMHSEGRLVQAPGTFLGELSGDAADAWTRGPANTAIRKPANPEEFMRSRPDEEGAFLPGSDMLWLRKKQPAKDDKDLVS